MSKKKRFLLRMDPALWEELNRWAAAEFRSVNGQIEFLLQQAVRRRVRNRSPKEQPPDPGADPTG